VVKKVILDCLGGDGGQDTAVSGARLALKRDKALNLVLIGNAETLAPALAEYGNRIEIIHSTTNIGMGEQPTVAVRQKPDASIVLGMDALRKRDDCTAILSAGSTGAVLTSSSMKVGRIEGVSRSALTPTLPTMKGTPVIVCDVGANMDCKALNLVHFAQMATVYLQQKGIAKPRIGLLNVGTEDGKGNELTHEAFKALRELHDKGAINFAGNMEAWATFSGDYDAVITDGFAGNVLLKTLEGTCEFISHELKHAISGVSVLLGKLILARRLLKMKRKIAAATKIAAIFLGMKKPVLKVHGGADAQTICNGLLQAAACGDMGLDEKISHAVAGA
jgi:glycerol-3-phosphate acyltransferase PlsX